MISSTLGQDIARAVSMVASLALKEKQKDDTPSQATDAKEPGAEKGIKASYGWVETSDGGITPVLSEHASDVTEEDYIAKTKLAVDRYGNMPYPANQKLPKGATHWRKKGLKYYPAYGKSPQQKLRDRYLKQDRIPNPMYRKR